jgi:hypothetical protein
MIQHVGAVGILDCRLQLLAAGEIDLNGLPWITTCHPFSANRQMYH